MSRVYLKATKQFKYKLHNYKEAPRCIFTFFLREKSRFVKSHATPAYLAEKIPLD